MDAQRRDEGAEPAGVQLGTPVLGPLVGQESAPWDDFRHDRLRVWLFFVERFFAYS